MRLVGELKHMMLYPGTRRFLIPVNKNKRKGAAILYLTKDMQITEGLMTELPYVYNPNYYRSFFIDRNVMAYVDSEGIITDEDVADDKFDEVEAKAISEAIMHNYSPNLVIIDIKGAYKSDYFIISQSLNLTNLNKYYKMFKTAVVKEKLTVRVYNSVDELERSLPPVIRKESGTRVFATTVGDVMHILSPGAYHTAQLDKVDGSYQSYLTGELMYYVINKASPGLNRKVKSAICTALSGQLNGMNTKEFKDDVAMAITVRNMINDLGFNSVLKILRTSDPSILSKYAVRKSILSVINSSKGSLTEGAKIGTSDKEFNDMKKIHDSLSDTDKINTGSSFSKPSQKAVYTDIKYNGKEPIAFVQAYRPSNTANYIYLYLVVSEQARGKGIAKSMCNDLIKWFKSQDEIHRIEWRCEKTNVASATLAISLGFEKKRETKNQLIFELKNTLNEGAINDGSSKDNMVNEVLQVAHSLSKEELDRITFDDDYDAYSEFVIYRDIVYYDKGIPIGFVDVYRFPSSPHIAQITIAVNPKYRGHGAAKSLVQKLMDFELDKSHGISKLIWNVAPDNYASISVAVSHGFKKLDDTLDKYGRLQYFYDLYDPLDAYYVSRNLEALDLEDVIKETTVLNEIDMKYNKRIRRYLYKERLRTNKQVLQIYADLKTRVNVKYTFMKLKQYNNMNLFVDLSYYHKIFLERQPYKMDKAVNMYFDFINRLINNPQLSSYKNQTIFIPVDVDAWDVKMGTEIYDFRQNLNPFSVIFRMVRTNPDALKRAWGDKTIIFVGRRGYFKIDFTRFSIKDLSRFKTNLRKLRSTTEVVVDDFERDELDSNDDIDKDSKKAIVSLVLDKIEKHTGIEIDDDTGNPDTDSKLTIVDTDPKKEVHHMEYLYNIDIPVLTMDGSNGYGASVFVMAPNNKSVADVVSSSDIRRGKEIVTLYDKD